MERMLAWIYTQEFLELRLKLLSLVSAEIPLATNNTKGLRKLTRNCAKITRCRADLS